ncbi:MAG TPA: gliding motility lipoprotein GldH [Puia sp.]|nr:gliding motility lipoprotein GldH [Puia sp.]
MKKISLFLLTGCLILAACNPSLDVFEKNVSLPLQQWQAEFKPQLSFSITDTIALYNIFVVIRHTDAYRYNNMWIRATVEQPGDSALRTQQYDITLASNDKGWFGSAMDDIYEHRALIQPQTKFKRQGEYHFTLEQTMREDPLQHVLNVGIRVEKVKS